MTISILAIETSTDACSIALKHDEQIYLRFEIAPKRHTQLILPMCESILKEAHLEIKDLSAIAFGCGPGSFTGLRIAAGITQGLAFAHHLPVIPISSLRVLAQTIYNEFGYKKILTGFDARMQEIYWGEYQLNENNLMQANMPDALLKPTEINSPAQNDWIGAGSAWQTYPEELKKILSDKVKEIIVDAYPSAVAVAQCAEVDYLAGKTVTAENARPVYLRDQIVKSR